MFKSVPRSLLRYSIPTTRGARPQRFFSTAPPAQRSRSWKNSAARWGLAFAGIYYYNTGSIFAEEPLATSPPPSPSDETSIPTLESIAAARQSKNPSPSEIILPTNILPDSEDLEDKAEEASQQGAFNEETGEFNWDCPCLGGMAHGTCGEQFKAAFSCFVFSKSDPKGMDCIENFKTMQDCFRQHPDEYGSEFEDEDAPDDPQVDESSVAPPLDPSLPSPAVDEPSVPLLTSKTSPSRPEVDEPSIDPQVPISSKRIESPSATPTSAPKSTPSEQRSENDKLVPKAQHESTPPRTLK